VTERIGVKRNEGMKKKKGNETNPFVDVDFGMLKEHSDDFFSSFLASVPQGCLEVCEREIQLI